MAGIPPSIRGTYLFGKETSYGSGGTATKDIGLVQTFSVNADANIVGLHGQGQAKAVAVKNGLVTPKGNIDILYQHGRILEWAFFGGTTTHAATSTDETHTFVWAETLPSLAWEASYEMGTTDIVQKGTGLIFNGVTLSSTVDGQLKVAGDWLAGTIDNSATSVTAAVVNAGAPLGGFENSLSLGGSPVGFTQSWEIAMAANTKVVHGEGTRAPAFGSSHERGVTFKARVGFENTTQVTRTLGAAGSITTTEPSSFAVILAADNGITLGSGKRAVTLTLSGAQFKYTTSAAKNDFVFVDIDGVGILSAGTAVDQVLSAAW